MPKTISAGVITQSRGAHLHSYLEALRESAQIEKVAIADDSGQNFAQARQVLGPKFGGEFKDTGKMLRNVKPELAMVSMEPARSPAAIDAALEAGCQVLTEKPACLSAADFRALTRKAQSKHLEVMLTLANRTHAPVLEAQRLIRENLLGKLYGIDMRLIADQARLTRESYQESWRCHQNRSGGGHLIWLGIHWLDLATFITGLEVQKVAAFTNNVGGQPIDVEDSASVCLQYNDNVSGTLQSAFYLDQTYIKNVARYQSEMSIWGEHGWIRFSSFEDGPMEWYSTKAQGEPEVRVYHYDKGQRSYTPFVHSAVRFAAGLEEEPPITSEEGLNVLETIYASYESARTGNAQTVGESG